MNKTGMIDQVLSFLGTFLFLMIVKLVNAGVCFH